MADVRIKDLTEDATPEEAHFLAIDDDTGTRKVSVADFRVEMLLGGLQAILDVDPTATLSAASPVALTTDAVGEVGISVTDGASTLALYGDGVGIPDGAVGLPSVRLSSDLDTGFYGSAAQMAVSVGGVQTQRWEAAGTTLTAPTVARATALDYAEILRLATTGTDAQNVSLLVGSDDPNGATAVNDGDIGSLFIDAATPALWQKTAASTWTQVGAGSHPDPHLLGDGSAAAPTYSFASATDTGMWWDGTDINLAVAGTDLMSIRAGFVLTTQEIRGPDGTGTTPTFAFSSESNTGMYLVGAGQLGWVVNAGNVVTLSATQATINRPTRAQPTLSAATGDEQAFTITPTVNKATSGDYTALRINVTETSAPGSDNRLVDVQVGGTSQLYITNAGQLRAADGDETNPSVSFINDIGMGLRRTGNNVMAATVNGADVLTVRASQLCADGAVGDPSAPPWTFESDRDTGFYRASANVLGAATAGVAVFSLRHLADSATTVFNIVPDLNQTAGHTTGFDVIRANVTETSNLGTGEKNFINLQKGGVTTARWAYDGSLHLPAGDVTDPALIFGTNQAGFYATAVLSGEELSLELDNRGQASYRFADGLVSTVAEVTYFQASLDTSGLSGSASYRLISLEIDTDFNGKVFEFNNGTSDEFEINYDTTDGCLIAAGDGAAGAGRITYGFINDSDLGMYLEATGIVGFSADAVRCSSAGATDLGDATKPWGEMHSYETHVGDASGAGSAVRTLTANLQTTTSSLTTLVTVSIDPTAVFWISAKVIGRDQAGNDRAFYIRDTLAYREGGSATLGTIHAPHTDEVDAAWDCTYTASGNNVLLQVQGNGETIDWTCEVSYQRVDP